VRVALAVMILLAGPAVARGQGAEEPETDVLTVGAIGVAVYAGKSLVHEGGHEVGCLLVGHRPTGFSTAVAGCDERTRFGTAAGAGADLVSGAALAGALAAAPPDRGANYYALWLGSTVSLLHGAGYLLVGPWAPSGDFSAAAGSGGVLEGASHPLAWKIGLSSAGLAMTFGTVLVANHLGEPLFGNDEQIRNRRRLLLTLVPYIGGSALITSSAFFNRTGEKKYVVTAALANFGGTLFLAYLPLFFNADLYRPGDRTTEPALAIPRSTPWLITGAGALVVTFAVFGPGIGRFPRAHPLGSIFGRPGATSVRLVPAPAPDAPGLVMNLATAW
jgi:hypothetical protein